MWTPYYINPTKPNRQPYGVRQRNPDGDTVLLTGGGGTADPGQDVRVGTTRLSVQAAQRTQLADGVKGKIVIEERKSYVLRTLALLVVGAVTLACGLVKRPGAVSFAKSELKA